MVNPYESPTSPNSSSGKQHLVRETIGFEIAGFVVATIAAGVLTAGSPIAAVVSTAAIALVTVIFVHNKLRRGFVWGWLIGLVLALFGTSNYIKQTYGPVRSYSTSERNGQLFDTISAFTIPSGVIVCAIAGIFIYRQLSTQRQKAT
ncbi:MAG: hypothetical protein GY880_04235 [Planctomycetaceae bacterium]|nr:hypothetical protein [Planctomycetaceae bacterium]